MSVVELAAEIVKSVVEARGEAITSGEIGATWKERLIKDHLSDDAVTELYKKVYRTVNDCFNNRA